MQSGRVVRPWCGGSSTWMRDSAGGELAELRVHDVAELVDELLVVAVVLVPEHARERGSADRAELQRLVGEPLAAFQSAGLPGPRVSRSRTTPGW